MKQDKQAKIAVVVHSLKPGGAEIMACRLAISLSHHYRCIIVALDTDGPLSTELMGHKVPYVALNRKRGFDLQLVNNLARIFQSENVSLIHAHQYTPFAYSLLARSRGSFVPVVFTEHGRFLPDRRRLRRLFFNRLVPRSEDKMTAVGESIAQALVQNEGISRDRVIVIPNGVDSQVFRPADREEKTVIRQQLGLDLDAFVIVMVTRLDPIKDHITALRTMEHVLAHCPRARLLIVGDGPLREQLSTYASARGLHKSVIFYGQQRDVVQYYKCADCLLLTSLHEGMPLSVLEAMACGLPVVTTACGDVPRIVEHGVTGFLTSVKDDALLAHYLLKLAESPEMRHRIGMAGRLVCQEKYSWSRTVMQYAQLYDSIIRQNRDQCNHDAIPVLCR